MDLSISVAIIAGLLLIITVFLIAVFIKAIKALTEAQKLMEMARLQIAPITHDLSQIVGDIRTIVKSVEKEMYKVGDSLSAIRDTTRNVKAFEEMIQERIERPLLDITAVLSALVKGGRVFWSSISRR